MELDDLRRQWQQAPAEAPVPLDAAALTRILARQSDGIVEKLRRSARLELWLNIGIIMGSLALAVLARPLWLQVAGWLLVVVGAVCIAYLLRKLHLLRRMDEPAGDLRANLARLAAGLRSLIRFYFWFTMSMLPVTGVLNVLMVVSTLKRSISLTTLPGVFLTVMLVLVIPALLYIPVASATKKYLQYLYGRHLDRLEASLRELAEPEAAVAD